MDPDGVLDHPENFLSHLLLSNTSTSADKVPLKERGTWCLISTDGRSEDEKVQKNSKPSHQHGSEGSSGRSSLLERLQLLTGRLPPPPPVRWFGCSFCCGEDATEAEDQSRSEGHPGVHRSSELQGKHRRPLLQTDQREETFLFLLQTSDDNLEDRLVFCWRLMRHREHPPKHLGRNWRMSVCQTHKTHTYWFPCSVGTTFGGQWFKDPPFLRY